MWKHILDINEHKLKSDDFLKNRTIEWEKEKAL